MINFSSAAVLSQKVLNAMAIAKEYADKHNQPVEQVTGLLQVVRISRGAAPRYWDTPWKDLIALAEQGHKDLSIYVVQGVERAPATEAWFEDCKSKGLLAGRACLYSQGW